MAASVGSETERIGSPGRQPTTACPVSMRLPIRYQAHTTTHCEGPVRGPVWTALRWQGIFEAFAVAGWCGHVSDL